MRTPRSPLITLSTLALAGSLALSACGTEATMSADTSATTTDTTTATTTADAAIGTYVALTELTELTYDQLAVADFDVETSGARAVTLADGATQEAEGVTVDGDVVTLTQGGAYVLTGSLTAGKVVIDAGEEDVTVVLDGVDITSPGVGALVVANADDVQLVLEAGSENSLADAQGATATDDVNATLFSTADLWIGGDGSLTVAAAEDGITSKDSLVIDGGAMTVSAGDDGVTGKDHLVVNAGDLTVDAVGDGLKADNEAGGTDASAAVGVVWIAGGAVSITAGEDGIQGYRQVSIVEGTVAVAAGDDGVHSEGVLRIADGTVTVARSYEGLEAAIMLVSGGDIDVTASDDGINVAGGFGVESGGGEGGGQAPAGGATSGERPAGGMGSAGGGMESGADSGRYLSIVGGTIVVNADGDGIDVGGEFTMTDGSVVVSGPTSNGNGALDVDGDFTVTGGSLLAAGSSGMAMAPTSDTQGTFNATFSGTVAAGTRVSVVDADGAVVVSYVTPKAIQSVVVTAPDVVEGQTYSLVTEGIHTGGSGVGPAAWGGEVSGGSSLGSLAAS